MNHCGRAVARCCYARLGKLSFVTVLKEAKNRQAHVILLDSHSTPANLLQQKKG